MNEVLAAMDTVKYDTFIRLINFLHGWKFEAMLDSLNQNYSRCYAWENSFQSKVQTVRDDELSWFRKAQLLSAVWFKRSNYYIDCFYRQHA